MDQAAIAHLRDALAANRTAEADILAAEIASGPGFTVIEAGGIEPELAELVRAARKRPG